jgi:hypothetical protein
LHHRKWLIPLNNAKIGFLSGRVRRDGFRMDKKILSIFSQIGGGIFISDNKY